ncbi:uncharacterized protein DS421_1g30160 [Arachis hypogaea]|nr:uncharacterized protein DS421_1g30160 [Arachis hypogaea]
MQRSSSVSRASGEFFIDLSTTASVGLPVMHNSNLYSALLSVSDDDDSKKESITDLINVTLQRVMKRSATTSKEKVSQDLVYAQIQAKERQR